MNQNIFVIIEFFKRLKYEPKPRHLNLTFAYCFAKQHVRHAIDLLTQKFPISGLTSKAGDRSGPLPCLCLNHFPLMISDICASLKSYRKKVE